jgi:hypothetical protein
MNRKKIHSVLLVRLTGHAHLQPRLAESTHHSGMGRGTNEIREAFLVHEIAEAGERSQRFFSAVGLSVQAFAETGDKVNPFGRMLIMLVGPPGFEPGTNGL